MPRSSLRTWLLFVSVIFALVVVGGIALTTYAVVSEGMTAVAGEATLEMVGTAVSVIEARAATFDASSATVSADDLSRFYANMPEVFSAVPVTEGDLVLYDADLDAVWHTGSIDAFQGLRAQAELARTSRRSLQVIEGRAGYFDGLVRPANLGTFIRHAPVALPDGQVGVLGVVYNPDHEEEVINAIRVPMAGLAISAMLIMVGMMQASMAWVLRLVDDVRKAADSIDAGRLDHRLPEEGEHEVTALARSINALIDRLGRRAQMQTRFVADASHELATPVAGIRGYVNILNEWGRDDPEVRDEAIRAIDRESQRMARLTGDLLTLVRSEERMVLRSEKFDLNEVCREILAFTATRYIGKHLDFEGPSDAPMLIVGDKDRIGDIVNILVDNAAKYTPEGGSVTVTTAKRRGEAVLTVKDTGIGIPASDLPNIFERFYRSDASRSQMTGGFGLGLAIAKSIVIACGGTIDVQSSQGVGTAFTVVLPEHRNHPR